MSKRIPSPMAGPATTTTKRPKRIPKPQSESKKSLVERVNALSLPDFTAQFFPPEAALAFQFTTSLPLTLTTWSEMRPPQRESCLNLIEQTSSSHYRGSEMGWSRSKKSREMRHPAMKYLILLPPPSPFDDDDRRAKRDEMVEGFLSFMVTEEDAREVVYCYELHLQPRLQGKGVGKRMMEVMEGIGGKVGVDKAMLTVFRSNERAVKAYERWGYGTDEFSPEARRLRDGTFREPGYVILSKEKQEFAREEKGKE